MADESLTLDEVRKMAAEIGLASLSEEHLKQLWRATNAARTRCKALPFDEITPTDEPSHVFRLAADDER